MLLREYGQIVEGEEGEKRYYVTLGAGAGVKIKIEVTFEVFELIEELQRELWRQDKQDYRHCVSVGSMSEDSICYCHSNHTPEQVVVQQYCSYRLVEALRQIPEKQCRRFLMRYDASMPIKEIAAREGCSERSIKYSLSLAKSNLRDILSEDDG